MTGVGNGLGIDGGIAGGTTTDGAGFDCASAACGVGDRLGVVGMAGETKMRCARFDCANAACGVGDGAGIVDCASAACEVRARTMTDARATYFKYFRKLITPLEQVPKGRN